MRALSKLRDGGYALGTMLMMDGQLTTEVFARAGYDFVMLDRQHGLIDDATLWHQIAAIDAIGQAEPWVRIPWNTPAEAMRALDGGARAIIAPMVANAAEAQALVKACRYPPQGARSWGPVRAGLDGSTAYAEKANSEILVFAMVEMVEAYEGLDEICAVEGLDGVFVGPNDLSMAMGNWQSGMPEDTGFIEVLKTIAMVAKSAGKLSGIHCADPTMAIAARGWGYDFANINADIGFIRAAAEADVEAVRGAL